MRSQGNDAMMADGADGGIGAVALGEVLRGMLLRRKMLILLSTLLFAALGAAVIMLSSPVYTAASQVLVEYEETPYTRAGVSDGIAAQPRQITDRDVRSQVEVIRSQDMALKVLRRLDLIGTPEFDPLKRGIGTLGRLKIALGFSVDPRRLTPEQRALAVWEKRLKVYSLPNTKVIVIEFDSSSPKTAAAVANTLAELYVEQTRSRRLQRTSEARQWLKQQIEKLRAKVVEAEKAVESHRARAGLFQGVQARLQNQELSELSAQIVRVAAERSQAEAKAKAIRRLLRQGRVEQSADVLNSRLIQRLREQQVQIRRRLAELSTIYLDNHPRVRAVRKELADLKRQIDAEARKIAESLEEQARIAAAREAELRARLQQMKKKVSAASLDEVKLRELEREAKAQRSLLESFLARYTDAMTRDDEQALPGMASIIARAMPPAAPSFPKPGPIMLLATLAGLVLGLGLAFILEVMAAVRRAEMGSVRQPAAAVPAAAVAAGGMWAAEQHAPSAAASGFAPAAEAGQGVPAQAAALAGSAASAARHAADEPHAPQANAGMLQSKDDLPRVPTASPATGQEKDGGSRKTPGRGVPDAPLHVDGAVDGAMQRVLQIGAVGGVAATAAGQAQSSAVAGGQRDQARVEEISSAGEQPAEAGAQAVEEAPESGTIVHAAQRMAGWVRKWHQESGRQVVALASLGLLARQDADAILHGARALAGDHRVMLVDVAEQDYLLPGSSKSPGLADLLQGAAGFADIVAADAREPRLHMVRAGNAAVPEGALHGEMMRELLTALRENYDLVLLHEGLPRYPLHEDDSALPLAEGIVILHSADEKELAEGLRGTLLQLEERDVALVEVAEVAAGMPHAETNAMAAEQASPDAEKREGGHEARFRSMYSS